MNPRFDIDALRTMVAGVDAGSFARAAHQLGRSQSAVSMQLKRLEEQAGQSLFQRSGRGLALTEAGHGLLDYARRIVDLHDEAARMLGASAVSAPIRLGLPQDFFENVMPMALTRFAKLRPSAHVEVRAGRNYALEEEVQSGQLDLALAFAQPGEARSGTVLATLPMYWFGGTRLGPLPRRPDPLSLVLFDHPCLFRHTALRALDRREWAWHLALTTPSLAGVWAALRYGHGITVRTGHAVPAGIQRLDTAGLPRLPALELRLFTRPHLPAAAGELSELIGEVARTQVAPVARA